jgi:hypothetical protein
MLWKFYRYSGLGKAVSFYRYFSFNLPRATTAAGMTLLFAVLAPRAYLLARFDLPAYLAAYFGLLIACCGVAGVLLGIAAKPALTRVGWWLGDLAALVSIVMYVASHSSLGLPGLAREIGRWDYALGTFAIFMAAGYILVHLSVLTGMNVAVPQRREWHD